MSARGEGANWPDTAFDLLEAENRELREQLAAALAAKGRLDQAANLMAAVCHEVVAHGHTERCETLFKSRGCRCDLEDAEAALRALAEARGEPGGETKGGE